MDASVIAAVKMRFWALQINRALGLLDVQANNIYKVDILEAMIAIERIWASI